MRRVISHLQIPVAGYTPAFCTQELIMPCAGMRDILGCDMNDWSGILDKNMAVTKQPQKIIEYNSETTVHS